MITTYNNTLYGLSTDDKPNNANNGIIFHEIDTSKEYMFDAAGKTWYEQTSSGSGGEGGGSGLFVVNITNDPETDVYTADKTIAEAMAAADSGKIIVMHDPETGDYAFATYSGDPVITWDYYWPYNNDPNPASLDVCHFVWQRIGGEETIEYFYATFTADSNGG